MIKKNLPTLKIHKLKRDKYNEIKSANAISDNEIYEITDAAVITETEKTGYDTHITNSDIHVTADEKAAWNESDVFVATYGTTTNAEIEAAYQTGKFVICKGGALVYMLTKRMGSTAHYFSGHVGKNAIRYVTCLNDVWSYEQPNFLPDVTTDDNDKILMVSNGAWAAVAITNAEEVAY